MKAFCIAFSMFSKLPVPQFAWKEKDIKEMIAFFPLVGVLIGTAIYLWSLLCGYFSVNKVCFVLIGTALPVLISGGIHLDGYMDTMDALHSYQNQGKKLEILKDAHIGAFSVIMLLLYYLIYMGAYFSIEGQKGILCFSISFWLSRILSALGVIYFPCAKKEGLGYQFSSGANNRRVKLLLYFQLFVCGAVLLYLSVWVGGAMLAGGVFLLGIYGKKCKKEFGGVTGDTSGYFTTLCEGILIAAAAAGCIINLV